MCGDADLVTYSGYHDMAMAFLRRTSLQEDAVQKYLDVDRFWSPLAHVPFLTLDYLNEAKLAYAFGLYRSSIFCCSAALDFELKRCLTKSYPHRANEIEKQTFGGSISFLIKNKPALPVYECHVRLQWINNVRNRIAVHSGRLEKLRSSTDDNDRYDQSFSSLRDFFTAEEIDDILNENKAMDTNWLEQLALKTILEAKDIISATYF